MDSRDHIYSCLLSNHPLLFVPPQSPFSNSSPAYVRSGHSHSRPFPIARATLRIKTTPFPWRAYWARQDPPHFPSLTALRTPWLPVFTGQCRLPRALGPFYLLFRLPRTHSSQIFPQFITYFQLHRQSFPNHCFLQLSNPSLCFTFFIELSTPCLYR